MTALEWRNANPDKKGKYTGLCNDYRIDLPCQYGSYKFRIYQRANSTGRTVNEIKPDCHFPDADTF